MKKLHAPTLRHDLEEYGPVELYIAVDLQKSLG